MPIRQLPHLVKLGKNICYAYRARSVEAVHLCKKLEHDLDAGSGTAKDCGRDGQTLQFQNVNVLQSENIHERSSNSIFASPYLFFLGF